jgi:hypothetical protein
VNLLAVPEMGSGLCFWVFAGVYLDWWRVVILDYWTGVRSGWLEADLKMTDSWLILITLGSQTVL